VIDSMTSTKKRKKIRFKPALRRDPAHGKDEI
jgi:hypothetical protein